MQSLQIVSQLFVAQLLTMAVNFNLIQLFKRLFLKPILICHISCLYGDSHLTWFGNRVLNTPTSFTLSRSSAVSPIACRL